MATDSAEDCLLQILQLNIQDRNKGIKLINKIFTNLINNPHEEKFKNLNFEKLSQKLQASQSLIDLLLIAGFVISPNQTRLYFDDDKMNDLLDTNKLLQSKINSIQNQSTSNNTDTTTEHKKQEQDPNNNDNEEEEEKKYCDDPLNTDNNKENQSKSSVLSYLMSMGYDEEEVLDALSASNNDANLALEILLQGTIQEHKFVGSTPQTKSHLKDLWNIPEFERMNGMKAFYKICSKLLDNLDNINYVKYHSLDYQAICKKFSECPPCIDLLQDAGFIKSTDGKRLQFNRLYMKNLSNVMQQMNDML